MHATRKSHNACISLDRPNLRCGGGCVNIHVTTANDRFTYVRFVLVSFANEPNKTQPIPLVARDDAQRTNSALSTL